MKNFNKYIFSILLFVGLSNAQILDVLTTPKFSISGKVVDIKEGTPLVGANVYLAGTSHGTATTEDGFYNISDQIIFICKVFISSRINIMNFSNIRDNLDTIDKYFR